MQNPSLLSTLFLFLLSPTLHKSTLKPKKIHQTKPPQATAKNNMSDRDLCDHHPKQVLVGVCPFCLNDKLLVIAANQQQHHRRSHHHHRHRSEDVAQPSHSRKPSHGGLLAFGSLLSRLELSRSLHRGGSCGFDADPGGSDTQSTSLSLEDVDSFISIKFEENGVASWDKDKVSETSWDGTIDHKGLYEKGKSYSNKSVGEHTKTSEGSVRWRKRIGHLLQLVRGKRLKKPNGRAYHDSCVDEIGEALKVRME